MFKFFKNGFKLLIPEYLLIAAPPISGFIKPIFSPYPLIGLGNILLKHYSLYKKYLKKCDLSYNIKVCFITHIIRRTINVSCITKWHIVGINWVIKKGSKFGALYNNY